MNLFYTNDWLFSVLRIGKCPIKHTDQSNSIKFRAKFTTRNYYRGYKVGGLAGMPVIITKWHQRQRKNPQVKHPPNQQ